MVLGENHINHLSKLELYILQDRKRRLVVRGSSQTRPLLLVLVIVSYIRLPPEIPRDIAFIPANPKVRAKMADIVNKVYCAI